MAEYAHARHSKLTHITLWALQLIGGLAFCLTGAAKLAGAEQMQATELVSEAARHQNACGPGVLAATVAAARALGTERGYLLDYTTSYDVAPEPVFRMAVGYAGLLF